MQKRILSAIALTMAFTLTLGVTAFAAESSNTSNNGNGNSITVEDVPANITTITDEAERETLTAEAETIREAVSTVTAVDSNGNAVANVTVTPVEAAVLRNAREVAATIAVAQVAADSEIAVVAGADIEIPAIPEGGITLTISLANFTAAEGRNYIVLHLNNITQTWETMDATVTGNTITAHFNSLSPIVVVEVVENTTTENGGGNANTNTNTNTNTNANSTPAADPAVSPKTGDALSVTGILAVICLAGVVVSAKKVRYNR
uniref:hypothetical protein n=1 Tax=Acetatifactor sp. TaxID=1872090 RepID=UPI004056F874